MVKVRKAEADPLRAALVQLALAEATLVANQAAFVAQQGEVSREIAQVRKETQERFQHIEAMLLRLLEVIPDALREKIGIQKK
jgi:hypothetical protein